MCQRRRAVLGPRSWGEACLVVDGFFTASWRKGRRKAWEGAGQRRVLPGLSTLVFNLMEEEFPDSNSMA